MAKRSVRREREQVPTPAPPAPAATGLKSRQFWLGALAAACLLLPLAIIGIVVAGNGGDEPNAAAVEAATPVATPTPTEQEILQEATQVRDQDQVAQLTDLTRKYATDLDPMVLGINKTLPPEEEGKVGPLASARVAERWVRETRKAAAFFDETVSGETGTNVARGALATAVRGLERTAQTYRLAVRNPELRPALLEVARGQRDDAIAAWNTAGVQLDVINVAVGHGHQHAPVPGSPGAAPDDLPEGSGATEGG